MDIQIALALVLAGEMLQIYSSLELKTQNSMIKIWWKEWKQKQARGNVLKYVRKGMIAEFKLSYIYLLA